MKSRFYAPQTKILERWTKDEMRIFREASIKLRNFRPPLKERGWVWYEYSYLGQFLHELNKPRMMHAHVWKIGPNVSTHTILNCFP